MSQNAAPIAQINVTPLVDVLLVLLIIFMITAPTLTDRLVLTLPQPVKHQPPPPPEPLRLRIAGDGALALDGQRISANVLAAEIAFLAEREQPPGIEIDADDAVAYAHIVDVLGTLKNEGLTRVSFKTHGN